jgi:hypothetical protein
MTVTLTGLGTMPIVVNKIDTCVLRVRPMVMGQPLFDSLVNVCQVTTPVALSPARAPGVFGLTVARTAGGVAIAWGAPVEANVAIYRSNGSLVASAVVHGSNYLWQARSESAGQYLCVVRSGNARVATTFVW